MLRAMLPLAAEEYGIERALVTCDHDNVASHKVVEPCGGVFEDQRGEKLRYWVPTRPTRPTTQTGSPVPNGPTTPTGSPVS